MKILFYLLWMILLSILQPTFASGIAVWGIAPNLFLCFVVLVGCFRGAFEGAVCGMVFGLVYDLLVGRMVGVSSLIYLYLGLGAGLLGTSFFSNGKQLAGCVGAMAGTLVAGLVYYVARTATGSDIGFVTAMFRISLIEAVYNGVLGFLMVYPLRLSMKMIRHNGFGG